MGDGRGKKRELVAEIESLRKELADLTESRDSDLQRALDALRENEARLRRLTENATDLIAEVDSEGRFLFVSANCEAMLGYPVDELIGEPLHEGPIFERVHPEDRELLATSFASMVGGKSRDDITYRYRRADGAWRWFDSKGRAFRTEDGEWRAVVISRDVTEQQETLHRLRRSEERYRVLFTSTSDLVCELDPEGRLLFVSPSIEKMLGYKPSEILGTTPFSLVHRDDVERLAELFVERLGADRPPRLDEIYRVRHRDGSWRWFQGGGMNFESMDGATHLVSVSRDITDRLRAADERRKLEEWVQQAQKLESLGMMAGGVAHDFNNLLTPILGDAGLALMDLPPDSPARARLERIQRAAHRAAALTNQLLDYAGIGSVDTEPLDLSKLALEMGDLLQSAVSREAITIYELERELPAVDADSRQISQVILNLITNASEAIDESPRERGRIAIRTGTVEAAAGSLAELALGEGLPDGSYVYFEVEDDGSGMEPDVRARIFDPFFTTKFTGRGLGLAAVLGIVRKHGGAIDIDSHVGRGTRIRVLLPVSGDPARSGERTVRPTGSWHGSGTVLVADDDEGVRQVLSETLTRTGLRVLGARDGREAVEVFRRHGDEIRLVVLDRTMPGTSGEQAMDEIRRIREDVPVLLVSGYSAETSAVPLTEQRDTRFLQKPFLPEQLVQNVRDLLGE